jgi:hypothetical protein
VPFDPATFLAKAGRGKTIAVYRKGSAVFVQTNFTFRAAFSMPGGTTAIWFETTWGHANDLAMESAWVDALVAIRLRRT